jgi:hypothetical protein
LHHTLLELLSLPFAPLLFLPVSLLLLSQDLLPQAGPAAC